MAESLDFQINDLKFRAAISDKFPYARATAPFRKEQFDSAPTVGDQSLAGWWTRGQLSFHKGSGLKYYEVLEGEAVLNRSQDSLGVVVREPGQVTLDLEPEQGNTSIVEAMAPMGITAIAPNRFAAVVSGTPNTAAIINDSTTTAITTTGEPHDVASNQMTTYFATASGLERVNSAGTGTTVDWGKGTGLYEYPVGVWYAKNRFFAVTGSGDWHTMAAESTGTLASTSAFWQSGLDIFSTDIGWRWHVTDSPGAVYVGLGHDIYSFTIDADGGVPVLSAGITVATLPNTEVIQDLKFALGHLVICTDKGVRFAATLTNDGLVYGPRIGGPATSVDIEGSLAYVTQRDDDGGNVRVVTYDMTQPLADQELAFAKADWWDTGTTSDCLVRVLSYPRIATPGGIYWADPTWADPQTDAYLTTGYHRLGTLDGKHFQSVTVRAEDSGLIDVYMVSAKGVETHLGSMSPLTEPEKTFSFGLEEPIERLALKFVLNPTGALLSSKPTLLGYQIKALPAPIRQRLIQWPVVATDSIRDRYGVEHGRRDGAWDVWSTLEALEESDALVTFTDHRTGETGEAYIESVELQSDTPSQGATSGFGGVGMITLRKVG